VAGARAHRLRALMLNLIFFHRLLIAAAIVFSAFFAVYEILNDKLVLGIIFVFITFGLGWYLRHLNRVLKLPEKRSSR
jgi:hypothetical protein